MKKLLLLFVLVASTLAVHAADLEWNVSDWTGYSDGDTIVGKSDNLSVTIDGLTLYSDEGYYLTYATGNKTVGDVTYTARVKTNGAGKTTRRAMKFVVDGPCEIAATIAHGSSSGDARSLIVYDSIQATQIGTISAEANATVCDTVTYSGDGTTIILYSDANIGIYDIQVTYTTSDDVSSGTATDTLLVYTITAADTASSHVKTYLEAGPGTIYLGASKVEASTVAPSGYAYKLDGDNSSSNTKYVLLTLADGVTFQAGDIISMQTYCGSAPSESKPYGVSIYTELGGDSIASDTLSAKNTLETFTYIVSDNDGISGVSAIYVQRNYGWSTYFYSATIIRESTATTIERATIDNWATFSSSSNVSYDTESVKAYTATLVTDNDTTYIQLAQYDGGGVLPAETGFLLYSTDESITLTTTTTEATVEVSTNDLIATCDTVFTVTESKKYYGLGSGATFYPIAVGGTAPANRAYLIIESDASAITMSIVDSDSTTDSSDDTTGISSVETAVKQDGVYYNLQGMRVSEPASGIYIVNGKKVIIK